MRFDKTDFYIELPNGSQIWIAGLDDKERVEKILGAEYATLYFNESSQIPWGSVETAMSRLAQQCELAPEIAEITGRTHLALKAYFDCNPPSKLHWSYSLFRAGLKPGSKEKLTTPGDYAEMQINPADNTDNLPPKYFEVLANMSAARRLRFEAGEWASEVNGALWSLENRKAEDGRDILGIDATRAKADDDLPDMQRIVVSVDPSGTSGEDDSGDSVGIVVSGKGVDGRAYVMADRTCKLSPDGWGRRAVAAYREFKADLIVAERNFGGAMVEHVVRTVDPTVNYKEVTASRGKVVRAEPVAALYEQGRVSHVGTFEDLEDQMVNMTVSGYVGEGSPDRVDALVWGLQEMMAGESSAWPVYQTPYENIMVENFSIPPYWKRSFAFEIKGDQTAAIWVAIDPSDGIAYAYSEHDMRGMMPTAQVAAIKGRGQWIQGVTAISAKGRTEAESRASLVEFSAAELNVQFGRALTDSSVSVAQDMLGTGRFKVFETLKGFERQYRTHHRNADGDVVEDDNLFMRCLRHWAVSGRDIATTKPDGGQTHSSRQAADRLSGY